MIKEPDDLDNPFRRIKRETFAEAMARSLAGAPEAAEMTEQELATKIANDLARVARHDRILSTDYITIGDMRVSRALLKTLNYEVGGEIPE
jgi:histone H3/H4